jgi:probable addiction module antidote protein
VVNEARSAPYVGADYLQSTEDIEAYLNAALEDGDERVLLRALRTAAEKTGGISRLAGETGLPRESLYRALSEDGNPRFSSLVAILKAMGLELAVRSRRDAA